MAAVPMCPGCRALLSPEEAACPYCGWNVRLTEVRREGGLVERALRPVGGLIPALIGANVLLFVATIVAQKVLLAAAGDREGRGLDGAMDAILSPRAKVLVLLGGNVPADVVRGQAWRLLCPVFLHGGLLHIFVNMMSLRNIGGAVVEAYGAGKALALYLGAGIAGNLASVLWFLWTGNGGNVVRIGASGAIFGLVGMLAALGFRIGGEPGKALWKPMLQSMGIMLVLGFVLNGTGGPILLDNTGHVGGFLFGFAAGWVCTFGIRSRGDLPAVRAWDAIGGLLALFTVAAFVPPALLVAGILSTK